MARKNTDTMSLNPESADIVAEIEKTPSEGVQGLNVSTSGRRQIERDLGDGTKLVEWVDEVAA